ncbi:hypothetical protein CF326_g5064 [Tilletia indica]|uniref:Uncharacterized protein n=1 Tax=Tilletia indica TaxID=43049 RepID=A0A177TQS5_9BASI|nr:hypothetical protein CF326_g5064 [Tilletia indica]KAE8260315.1 hypothetical protein A4X13_0g411 [Tilletia indica]
MPAVRHTTARRAKPNYITVSVSPEPREFITIDDSSDEEKERRVNTSKATQARSGASRAAASSSVADSESRASSELPESGGRRRSARQASRQAENQRKGKDPTPSSSPSGSRRKASLSKRKTPSVPPDSPSKQQQKAVMPFQALDTATAATIEKHEREIEELKTKVASLDTRVDQLETQSAVLTEQVASYTKTIDGMEDYLMCGICMDVHLRPFTIEPCGHNCCIRCLYPWLAEHKTCPLCAVSVKKAFPNSDMHALAQLFVEAHPDKKHAQGDCNEAETLYLLARESSTVPNFVQLLPQHAPRPVAPPQNAEQNDRDQAFLLGGIPLAQYHVQLPQGRQHPYAEIPQGRQNPYHSFLNRAAQQAQAQVPAPAQAHAPPAAPARVPAPVAQQEPHARPGYGTGLFPLNYLLGR